MVGMGGALENIKNLNWEIGIDKPVIISEFGAGALQGYHGDEQTIWSEAYQNALYRRNASNVDENSSNKWHFSLGFSRFLGLQSGHLYLFKMDGTAKV